jgi:hypothetical protein
VSSLLFSLGFMQQLIYATTTTVEAAMAIDSAKTIVLVTG